MASPFPGMDPYLEDPLGWRDVHASQRPSASNDVILAGDALWVVGPSGLDILARAGSARPPRRATTAHLAEGIRIDGSLAEWSAPPTRRLSARGGGEAELYLAHADGILHLGLRFPGPRTRHSGRLDLAPGCRLDLALNGHDSRRYSVDLGRAGPEAWQSRSGDVVREEVRSAIRRDPASGLTVLEASVPLEDLADTRVGDRTIGMSLAIHDERAAGKAEPVVAWGSGLAADRILRDAQEIIAFSPIAAVSWEVAHAFHGSPGARGLSPSRWRVRGPGEAVPSGAAAPPFAESEILAWEEREPKAGLLPVPGFQPSDPRVAYAAVWIHAERESEVVFDFLESDCDIQAWIGNSLLLHPRDRPASALPRAAVLATLPAGASRVLVGLGEMGSGAAFGLEVRDRSGWGAPEGVSFTVGPSAPR